MLTLNEEPRLEGWLKHHKPHLDWLYVVDGGSTDKTQDILKAHEVEFDVDKSKNIGDVKNAAWNKLPKDIDWVMFLDADEKFDGGFLERMKIQISEAEKKGVKMFRFPRVNLPDGKNWPDYQVRLVKNDPNFRWHGEVHEIMMYKIMRGDEEFYIKADQLDVDTDIGVSTVLIAPIVHLERRKDIRRNWW